MNIKNINLQHLLLEKVKLPKKVVDVAEGKNELPQGTTNEQIRALQEQSKEQETRNKQIK